GAETKAVPSQRRPRRDKRDGADEPPLDIELPTVPAAIFVQRVAPLRIELGQDRGGEQERRDRREESNHYRAPASGPGMTGPPSGLPGPPSSGKSSCLAPRSFIRSVSLVALTVRTSLRWVYARTCTGKKPS